MYSFERLSLKRLIVASGLALAAAGAFAFEGVGRPATPKEIAAWDIDVRPDFKGLPKGAGSVQRGQEVWDARCASCHGTFGESNEVFTPIVGGTTAEDVRNGRVAALSNGRQPQRTTLMKLSTVSTLWDYIYRAIPWNEPKSLSVNDVYAVTAYILNMGEIVPDDFELSDRNIGQVQARLPNRHGMSTKHGLWDVRGKPDVRNQACMKNCPVEITITSALPAHAKAAHGNLAEQHRQFGPVRGVALSGVAVASARPTVRATEAPAPGADGGGLRLAQQHACTACHVVNQKLVGPSFQEIGARYKGDAEAGTKLAAKVRQGGAGAWGQIPMPAQPGVPAPALQEMLQWILSGAR